MSSIDDVVSNLKNGVQNLSAINTTLKAIFPQSTGTSATATGGSATLPANPAGFINATLQDGTPILLPYYTP